LHRVKLETSDTGDKSRLFETGKAYTLFAIEIFAESLAKFIFKDCLLEEIFKYCLAQGILTDVGFMG